VTTNKTDSKIVTKPTKKSAKAAAPEVQEIKTGSAPTVSQTTDAAVLAAIDTSGYVLPGVKVPGRRGRKPKEYQPENEEIAALNAVERAEMKAIDKAKAKDRKAKEKALLKDAFSSDPEATEEELERRRQKLKTLIKLGKDRGYLTFAEINDHLPENVVDPEAIEGIISTFNDMGVAVYERALMLKHCCYPITSLLSRRMMMKWKRQPRLHCQLLILISGALPIRFACICVKWARLNC
jgi:RNA polymerase primary sigma factor